MEVLFVGVIVIAVAAYFVLNQGSKTQNGSNTTKGGILDVNKDGNVDVKDVAAAVEVVVAEVKKTATKAKTAVKKTATVAKKTVAKKVPAKKPKAK